MSDALEPLRVALEAQRRTPRPVTRLATVTGFSGSGVLVQFDGESAASTKPYPRLRSATVQSGDRVLMLRSGSTWVVADVIAAAADEGVYRHLSEHTYAAAGSTTVPNTGTYTSVVSSSAGLTKPAGTRGALITAQAQAIGSAAGAAAGFWRLRIFDNGPSASFNRCVFRVHNQGTQMSNVGCALTTIYKPAGEIQAFLELSVDAGGLSIVVGMANVQIQFLA